MLGCKSQNTVPCFCSKCIGSIFPFSSLNNRQLHSLLDCTRRRRKLTVINLGLNYKSSLNVKLKPKCNICKKIVRKPRDKFIICDLCHSRIHLDCSNLTTHEISVFKNNNLQSWYCHCCLAKQLPFHNLREFGELAFNSNFTCSCLKSMHLDELDLNTLPKFDLLTKFPNLFKDQFQEDTIFLGPDFKYYSLHDFHKLVRNNGKTISNSLSLLHSNIRSINFNFGDLYNLVRSLDHHFSAIALSELWLPESKLSNFSSPILSGYHKLETLPGKTLKSG